MKLSILKIGTVYEARHENEILKFRVKGHMPPEINYGNFGVLVEDVELIGSRPYIAESPPKPSFSDVMLTDSESYEAKPIPRKSR